VKTLRVSLLVTSSSVSLDELSLKLKRPHSSGSHEKGEAHVLAKHGRPPWSKTVWRFDSSVSESAPVKDHLEDLKVQFPPAELRALLPPDCTVCVDIAIFFDTVNVSASIPCEVMEIIAAYHADLEVTCYPSWAGLEKKK
jgi:hypothetical protein